jgi:hypothetical protein
VSPQPDQPLILYVSTTHIAVRGALVQEGGISNGDKKMLHQVPIYYVSEPLAGSKKYYLEMENICYVVVMSARKLQHYFEAHRVRVLTNQPLNDIFENHDSSGRIGKWAMELSEHVLKKHHKITTSSRLDGAFKVYRRNSHRHTVASIL